MALLEIVKYTKTNGEPFNGLQEFLNLTSDTAKFFEENFPDERFLDAKFDISSDQMRVVSARVWADAKSQLSWKNDLSAVISETQENIVETTTLFVTDQYKKTHVQDINLDKFLNSKF